MRRVLAFLCWRSGWWKERAKRRKGIRDRILAEGLNAYALRQAALQANLASSFRSKWAAPLREGIQELTEELEKGEEQPEGEGDDDDDDDNEEEGSDDEDDEEEI